ncbi:MAG: HWE histidine kinase domain-containing protein [Hyphomicrobiaceae bacterium]
MVNVVSDVTERAIAEQQAAEYLKDVAASKARFETLVQATSQIVWTAARSGELVEDSPSWRQFTGQTYDQFRGTGWLDAVHPDDRDKTIDAWRHAVDSVSPYQVDYRLLHIERGYRWTTARGVLQLTGRGEVIEWVGMNEDISDRVAREEHLQVILRELSHRTKNLLAVVQAIARRSFGNSDLAGGPLKTFRDRLRGLAISHDLLVSGDWTGISLEQLVR